MKSRRWESVRTLVAWLVLSWYKQCQNEEQKMGERQSAGSVVSSLRGHQMAEPTSVTGSARTCVPKRAVGLLFVVVRPTYTLKTFEYL